MVINKLIIKELKSDKNSKQRHAAISLTTGISKKHLVFAVTLPQSCSKT